MMQNEKNPSDNTASSKNSTKTKKVEDNGVSKKQGIKFPFEDLKKQAEKKLNPDINYSDDDSETATTNAQALIAFDKNEALGEENKLKHNQTGGINMNENIDASTPNAVSTDDMQSSLTAYKDPVPLDFEDNYDDEDEVITVKGEPLMHDTHNDTNVTAGEPIPLSFEGNYDEDDEVKTVRVEPFQESSINTITESQVNQMADNTETQNKADNAQSEDAPYQEIKREEPIKVTNNSNEITTNQMTDKIETINKTEDVPKVKTDKEIEEERIRKEKEIEEERVRRNKEIEEDTKRKELETKNIDKETDQIKAIEAQKQARRAAIKNLFEATGGNIPKMFDEVNKELKALMKVDKKLELDNINFSGDSALSAYRTPTFAASYALDPKKDFFGMGIAEQDLLFERIGLFKGVVVDYSKENAIEQGYRNVVKFMNRPAGNNTDNPAKEANRSKPVKVFYKKPRHSGFYETSYAFDEYQKKSQESGIFNLGFGLSASYNSGFVSAGVKAGYSYSKESLSEANTHIKEISIISSFYLPKIELSFDTLQPCADDDLIAYIEHALESEQDTVACFDRINTILMSYGQFVPTSMIIGARLYSSDTKKIKQGEIIENVLSKHAANFQASISGMVAEAGVEGKMEADESSKSNEKSTSEAQNVQFRAIGGEGAVISDMGKWVTSTADAMYWGLIRFDNLVPVIDLLPYDLQKRITDLFNRVIEECTIEDLLSKGSQFLFHKGYFERFGSKAQPKFCIIKNSLGGKQVLSVRIDGELESNQEVTMSAYDGIGGEIQEWYFANSGKIYLKSNYDTDNKFVLSIDASRVPSRLVITQDNYFDNQLWDARGGMIQNINGNYITYDGNKIQLEAQKENAKNNTWLLIPEKEINTPSRRRIEQTRKNTLMLLDGVSDTLDNNYFLPINGTLKSQNGYAQLKFSADKIVILWGKGQKEIWNHPITISGASKLGITNGTFAILDEKDNILEEIATNIVDIRLMDSGNLEAIDRDNSITWETNSIVYAYIQSDISKVALSVRLSLNSNGLSEFKTILTQEYIGGPHQHWYLNRKNNIISRFTENKQKFALTETVIEVSQYYDSFSGSLSGAFSAPAFNQPGTQKRYYMELGVLNIVNAKSQQWGGLVPNRKGSIQNLVSKTTSENGFGQLVNPNEKWELIFDENARQEANTPIVSFARGTGRVNLFNLVTFPIKLALRDIPVKGPDILGVCLDLADGDTLSLKFKDRDGKEIKAETILSAKGCIHFNFPALSSPIYFSDEQTHLSLIEKESSGAFQLEFQTQRNVSVISHQKIVSDNDYIAFRPLPIPGTGVVNSNYEICSDWVLLPENQKAIGITFTSFNNIISPCLISVKR